MERVEQPEMLTIQEAADLLRISSRHAYQLAAENALPGAIRLGGRWIVRRFDLERWMDDNVQKPAMAGAS